jgi:flagellar M-ring protein FliF
MLIGGRHDWPCQAEAGGLRVQNIIAIWSQLSMGRRVVLIGATVGMFVAIIALGRIGSQTQTALLYADLDPAAAGAVVAALDQEGVPYTVDGTAIRVPADLRDSLRMRLAGQGIPTASGAGYEVLEGLTGFGTTAQMFDAAYWRAKEGELARTILSNPAIRSVRVHIAQAPESPFARGAAPTASVAVVTAGAPLPTDQAVAIRHLVAAAVPGLTPDGVTLIDSLTGRISGPEDEATTSGAANERAAAIRAAVIRLLEARVGPGRVVAEVNVEIESAREEITERIVDPESRVAISSETEESSDTSSQQDSSVTVASNLPEGEAADSAQNQSQASESRERVNYEVSQTERAVLRMPGDIKRLTVAVLVDGEEVAAADGTLSWQPRAQEELDILRDLVASAVGVDEARGDVLTLRSLQFPAAPSVGTLAEGGGGFLAALNAGQLIQTGILALVAVLLGLFVVKPILAPKRLPPPPLALPPASARAAGADANLPVLTGEIAEDLPLAMRNAEAAASETDPMDRLRRLVAERQTESVEVLRSWLEREEQKA